MSRCQVRSTLYLCSRFVNLNSGREQARVAASQRPPSTELRPVPRRAFLPLFHERPFSQILSYLSPRIMLMFESKVCSLHISNTFSTYDLWLWLWDTIRVRFSPFSFHDLPNYIFKIVERHVVGFSLLKTRFMDDSWVTVNVDYSVE